GASRPAASVAASLIGIVTLALGATSTFNELQNDLDRIWRAPSQSLKQGLWGMLRSRLLSFEMIVAAGFLLLASLVVSAGLSALGKWWGPMLGGWVFVLQTINFVVSFAIVMALFALIYKYLPRVPVAWGDVWMGAAVTALL